MKNKKNIKNKKDKWARKRKKNKKDNNLVDNLDEDKDDFFDPILFNICLQNVSHDKEFIKEFNQTYGYNLSRAGLSIDLITDDETGFKDDGTSEFVDFVYEAIYLPIVAELMQDEEYLQYMEML